MKHILFLTLALLFTLRSQAQTDIEQLYGAPGGGYIIFTDWGDDYPLPGIQEYHKWSDLHLVDTFAINGDQLCISLFMDSVAMNCVTLEGMSCGSVDTIWENAEGDSLFVTYCDSPDTLFFTGGGGGGGTYSALDVNANQDGGNVELFLSEGGAAFGWGVKLIPGAGITLTQAGGPDQETITIASTIVDTDTDNQNLTLTGTIPGPFTINIEDGTDIDVTATGIITLTEPTPNTLNIHGQEVDGSNVNELQTLANTSDATSHTTTLSNSGGSLQLIEGSGISLTTGGTGLDGTVTIANTGDTNAGDDMLSFNVAATGTPGAATITNAQTVTFDASNGSVTRSGNTILVNIPPQTNDDDWHESGASTPPSISADGFRNGKTVIGNDADYFGQLNITRGDYNKALSINNFQGVERPWIAIHPTANDENNGWYHIEGDGGGYNINELVADVQVTPFRIEPAIVDGVLTLEADGDIKAGLYPDTRDDSGTPANILSTDANGVVQSHPVSELPADGDGNSSNELQDITVTGASQPFTLDLSSDATDATFTGAGTVDLTRTGNAITITGTADGDGSSTNELQELQNTSDATSHTVTLTTAAGSVQLVEGTNITLTTTGTADDGIVTIAATGGGSDQTLDVSGTGPIVTLDLSADATDPTITGSGAAAVTASGNDITVGVSQEAIQDYIGPMVTGNTETGIAVTYDDAGNMFDFVVDDASATNEIQTLDASGTGPTITFDLSSDASDITITEGGVVDITATGNAITIGSSTEAIQDAIGTMVTGNTETNIAVTYDDAGNQFDFVANDDQSLTFLDNGTDADLQIDDGVGVTFVAGTNITLTPTATTLTIAATGGGAADHDWYEETTTSAPNNIDDHMFTGTGDHGFGTTTPDAQVHITNSLASGPDFKMEYSTGTDVGGVMGTIQYEYGSTVLAHIVAQKQTSSANNDSKYSIQLKDNGGAFQDGLEVDYETGFTVDKPRVKMFGGEQNQNWVNITSTGTTQLDEGHFGVRVTGAGATVVLPLVTVTNTEGIGTKLIIYNRSGGPITVDPGTSSDAINGGPANGNITLVDKESKWFICTFIDGSNNADWITID